MRRKLRVPQIAAVMGACIAGGAYLPALSDYIIMVEGTSFMGLGGPNLVKGATGQVVDSESIGGARMHTTVSGVAHYMAKDDAECLERIRQRFRDLPAPSGWQTSGAGASACQPPALPAEDIYGVLPENHRLPYDIEEVIFRIFDAGDYTEFQPEYAPEMLCANARLSGHPVAIIANRRGFLRSEGRPRIGGIVYTESARKVAYFVELNERLGYPLIYLQDVSGFMVGPEAEREGIVRAGADMVEAMSCTSVPKLILTLNHASGAGYYAMAGQGFEPNFTFSWPTARIGVMEGDSAVQALFSVELEKLKAAGEPLPKQLEAAIEKTKSDYDHWLDARYAAARGHCDAVIDPLDTRQVLTMALEVTLHRPRAVPLILETL
jgi:acetyl-CoA carboxylase carboxyltransferase component